VIKTFRSKPLADLWTRGRSRRIDARLHARILIRLAALDESIVLDDLKIPGFDFHALRGFRPTRYTIHVNGPWRITFEFDDGHVFGIDLEQYH
jgi:proteic killer suppression protein